MDAVLRVTPAYRKTDLATESRTPNEIRYRAPEQFPELLLKLTGAQSVARFRDSIIPPLREGG